MEVAEATENVTAPAVDVAATLAGATGPLVEDNLVLTSTDANGVVTTYVHGADYLEEPGSPGSFTNLAIPEGTALTADYFYYVAPSNALGGSGGSGGDPAAAETTVDQTLASPADTGPISSLLSWIAGRLRAVTGEADWKTAPATTLKASATHHGRTDNPHGTTAAQTFAAPASHVGAGGAAHAGATPSTAGFLSAAGKTKLDGIEAGAQKNLSAQAALDRIKTVDGASSGLDADLLDGSHAAAFASATAPFVNLMSGSGKFTAKGNPLAREFTTAFQNSGFFSPFNGATVAEAGKFVHNNSTNGGNAGALAQPVIDLLAAMGRSGDVARFGVEFFVAEIVAGSGTGVSSTGPDGVTRHLVTINGSRAMFAFAGSATLALWMRALDRDIEVTDGNRFRGGNPYNGILRVSDGWSHIRHVMSTQLGYFNSAPGIRARSGDRIQIAVPAWFAGPVDPGIHTAPLPTINEFLD